MASIHLSKILMRKLEQHRANQKFWCRDWDQYTQRAYNDKCLIRSHSQPSKETTHLVDSFFFLKKKKKTKANEHLMDNVLIASLSHSMSIVFNRVKKIETNNVIFLIFCCQGTQLSVWLSSSLPSIQYKPMLNHINKVALVFNNFL